MTTDSAELLTPFDLQVLSLAHLHRAGLSWTQNLLVIPEVGTFTRQSNGNMQMVSNNVASRFARVLSHEGGRQLGELHFQLLTQPLDMAERDLAQRVENEAVSPLAMGAASVQRMQQMQAIQNAAARAGLSQADIAQYTHEAMKREMQDIANQNAYLVGIDPAGNLNNLGKL